MAATDVIFNLLNFNDGSDYITSELDDSAPWERNTSMYTLARKNGATVTDDEYTTKPITVTGLIQGTSVADLEANIDAFNAALSVTQANLDIAYGGGTRRYVCIPSSFNVERPVRAAAWANFSITFTALNYGTDTAVTHLITSTNITAPHDFSVTMGGSAPDQYMMITITVTTATIGSSNTITVKNPDTGETLTVTRLWTAGDVLTLDTLLLIAKVNGTVVDYGGAFPSYKPGSGQTLHIEADFTVSNTTTLTTSQTWTAPALVTSAYVELWGGGGGGGGAATNGAAGGGAGGFYAAKRVTVVPATGYAVVIGAGGTAGTTAGTFGGSGGNSTFASTVVIAAGNGGGGAAPNGTAGAGSHPNSSVGDIIYNGGSGGLAQTGTSGGGAGGGGESGGPSGAGHNGAAGSGSAGGVGGTGNADAGDGNTGGGSGSAGANGFVPGGAGSGGSRNGTSRAGGAGAAGQFRVTYLTPSYTMAVVSDTTKLFL